MSRTLFSSKTNMKFSDNRHKQIKFFFASTFLTIDCIITLGKNVISYLVFQNLYKVN